MKDYKARGSTLQFRDRKRRPRIMPVALVFLVVAAAATVMLWPRFSADTSGATPKPQPTRSGVDTAIPLELPPAPSASAPTDDADG
jgi:uncharacterized protein involved in exopolysaccharide biosynthesis